MTKFFGELGSWVKHHAKSITKHIKHRPLLSFTLAIFGILFSILISHSLVNALTSSFVQTNWAEGADVISTINDTNLSGWNKFYSKTDGINTSVAGEVSLNLTITQP